VDPTYEIDMIEICPDRARRARVIHPSTGVAVWHGLGDVGEPLLLGHRAGETRTQRLPRRVHREVSVPAHYITLPSDRGAVTVVRVGRDGRPSLGAWADLRVPDGAW